jgi:hypothetical protein
MREPTASMGISGTSLYSAFGGKRCLHRRGVARPALAALALLD